MKKQRRVRICTAAVIAGISIPALPALAAPGPGRPVVHNDLPATDARNHGQHQQQRPKRPQPRTDSIQLPVDYYTFDGTENNREHPSWGAAGTSLLRLAPYGYTDKISTPAGASRTSARTISNELSAQDASTPNDRNMSDFVYVWGQFLDHDIDLSETGTSESLPIIVPSGDKWFDPTSSGTKRIGLQRSLFAAGTGTSVENPREQVNVVTAFVDGSQVYGSNKSRADALRTFTGGLLRTSTGNMLPFNTTGLPNANDSHAFPNEKLYLAGDIRANENPDLIALQTLFMREHNRLASMLRTQHPSWTDEQLYQNARQTVIGEIQAITYNEFLPALLGAQAISRYIGYNKNINPTITNEFSTAAYRFGHSLLDSEISRLNNDGSQAAPVLSLAEAFFNTGVFNPALPRHVGDIDPFLKAAASGNTQEVDLHVVDELRNMLFGAPGSGGFDLAALNIQRGRDHGIADYNTTRQAYGLSRVTSFSQITADTAVQQSLRKVYGSVDEIDLWVGGLAEDHVRNSSVGPLFQRILSDQFSRLRDGDRNWYQRIFTGKQLEEIEGTQLSEVVQRNTALTSLQKNAFFWQG